MGDNTAFKSTASMGTIVTRDLDTFCYMVVEEFLMMKGMHSTLREYREEWDRPGDEVTIPSWYNVALKLQMPELLGRGGGDNNHDHDEATTLLYHIVKALAHESSVRSRRPMELTAHGLVTMPRPTVLPDATEPQGPFPPTEMTNRRSHSADRKERKKAATPGPAVVSGIVSHPSNTYAAAMGRGNKVSARQSSQLDQAMQRILADTSSLIPSKLVPIAPVDKYAPVKQNKASAENWIPDNVRMMQRMRDLKVAHQNIDDAIMLELDTQRALKGVNVTPYDKALKEEELGVTKKMPCACCLQKFLYVNLPLKVSEKAIIDIRVKWTGGMTSQTVWGDTLKAIVADTFEVVTPGSTADGDNPSSSQVVPATASSSKARGKLVSKKKVPEITPIKVYSDVLVCLFCSQFFHEQEKYRPSFADMVKAEKAAARRERLAREREYWDPLRMVEKDREVEEAARELALKGIDNKTRPPSGGDKDDEAPFPELPKPRSLKFGDLFRAQG